MMKASLISPQGLGALVRRWSYETLATVRFGLQVMRKRRSASKAHRPADKRNLPKAFWAEGPLLDQLTPEGQIRCWKFMIRNHNVVGKIPIANKAPWRKKDVKGSRKESFDP
jgi:hypothetical protein